MAPKCLRNDDHIAVQKRMFMFELIDRVVDSKCYVERGVVGTVKMRDKKWGWSKWANMGIT